MSAGEDGLVYIQPEANCGQRHMGHVQRLAVGKFLPDRPGLQLAIVIFHGNPGIILLFDSNLRRIWTREYPLAGATVHPVNWDGSGTELLFYTAGRPSQGFSGGMLDGDGDLVVEMPDDGGPCTSWDVLPFPELDDRRDRIVTWDLDRIWIYEPDAPPPSGRVYAPKRPPRHSMSNYQAYWSHPAWIA